MADEDEEEKEEEQRQWQTDLYISIEMLPDSFIYIPALLIKI